MNFEKTLQIGLEHLQSFGRLYFTPKQLFYEFCRAQRAPLGIPPKTAAAYLGLGIIPTMFLPKNKLNLLLAGGLILGSLALLRKTPHTLPTPILWEEFSDLLEDYLQKHQIEGLLKIERKVKFAKEFSDDLMLYGLPKVLICEADEIAQMLRANQFHLQTPCAVLSVNEAKPLSENIKKMISNAEAPQVFFLHDASLRAFSVLRNLREILDLAEEISLHPLGLRPIHAKRLHLFDQKMQATSEIFSEFTFLDEREKRWLADGFKVEVSAIPPVRLMRVLRRLILGLEVSPSDWQIALPKKNLGFM